MRLLRIQPNMTTVHSIPSMCDFAARSAPEARAGLTEREIFIDNLLVRIHLIIVMILVDRPCAMGV